MGQSMVADNFDAASRAIEHDGNLARPVIWHETELNNVYEP